MRKKYEELPIDDHSTIVKWAKRCCFPFGPLELLWIWMKNGNGLIHRV